MRKLICAVCSVSVPKARKPPPFLIVKFKGVGESADFKASERNKYL